MTVDVLTSLRNLIKQDSCAAECDRSSRQRLKRHIEKLASAAQVSFTKKSLLQDNNRSLYRSDDEAKVRRSTRSLVIGRVKVMKHEDLKRICDEHAALAKAAADEAKGARGCKRKATGGEADEVANSDGDEDAQEVGSSVSATKDKKAKRSRVWGLKPKLWRAPVALMYAGAT